MLERIKLVDFKPEKVAPNFWAFLQQRGEVTVAAEALPAARAGALKDDPNSLDIAYHHGLKKRVFLNGHAIGDIECYVNPPALYFEGEIPNCPLPTKHRRFQPRIGKMENSVRVFIAYHGDHPLARVVGRTDGWDRVPMP